ncbi:hypothetical protein M2323_000060 [Rhodoblastus acidophilus]|uniref:hypothetical protein n=1 Tax=Rhodoblastus acidophilus TaxID=1074 RepID=UPI0022259F68|nr:hypothetical protein [Rhodoblastus acidophilus]MCW2282433.1 hypothetical protein [Rhodoblastus acidophilus]MCW2331162.1 hypothetical protein [Rhodoblastus acidophilus]
MCGQSQLRESVLEWSLPVVHDCLREFYLQHFPARSAAFTLLSQLHFKLWTSLITSDFEAARTDAATLDRKAGGLKPGFDLCAAANRYVAAEVLDLSLRRFRRMPEEAMRNHQELLNILLRLAPKAAVSQAKPAFRRAA